MTTAPMEGRDRPGERAAGRPWMWAAPVAGGLLVLFSFIALIGFAIRSPQPHGIPLGVVGPPAETGQLSAAFAARAPGALRLTVYASEGAARAAIDDRSVDGALVLGAARPRLIVAGASGSAIAAVISGAVSGAFRAQGVGVTVEMVHPFPAGDPDGLVLFFAVLGALIASVVAGTRVGLLGHAGWQPRLAILAVYGAAAGLVGMETATWVAGGYGSGFWSAAGLLALAAAALAAATAGAARLLGAAGVALAAAVLVLFDVISSGGPLGSSMLPSFYGWLAQGMPAPQLYSALRGALFFDGSSLGGPIVVLVAWLAGGVALMGVAGVGRRALRRQPPAAPSAV